MKGDAAETNFPEKGVTIAVEIGTETGAIYGSAVRGGTMIPRAGGGVEMSLKVMVGGTTAVATTEEVESGVLPPRG